MAYPKIRIYRRWRPRGGAERWEYVCSTTRYSTIEMAVEAWVGGHGHASVERFEALGDVTGRMASTHGYYIED